jgi:ABC-type sugar transport system ATPase subunit
MSETLLEIKHISKFFPGVKALQDISFTINKAEIHALIGENGAGKSTLIKVLSGVNKPEEGGSITMNGQSLGNLTPIQSLKAGIVVIYQDFSLFPNLSVMENIALGLCVNKNEKIVDWKKMEETARQSLEQLGVKNIDLHLNVSELSVARQQLVAIAGALVNDAKLLILDEPTSSLSANEVENLFSIMRSLKKKGISMLFISHKLDELFAVSDRFTILRDGQCIGTYSEEDLDNDTLISLMVGRKIEYKIFEKCICLDPLLEVKNLSKKGNFRNINFTLNKGEIFGLTGLVGAGRTEVASAIFGLNEPDQGDIYLEGKKLCVRHPSQAVAQGIAFVPENRLLEGLVLRKSAEDNIAVTILEQLSSKSGLINNSKKHEITGHWMKTLEIKPNYPDMLVGKYSGGNKQRIVIAKWLATNPKVLIVDEPTNGIDIGAKAEIHQLLRDLAKSGLGIIVISSELPEILSICDRVAVMKRGRIKKILSCDGLTQENIMNLAL